MYFDLSTRKTALHFLLSFFKMEEHEFATEYKSNCQGDFELFWFRHFKYINSVEISALRIVAHHILGTLDNCEEIKATGIRNLQLVLSERTMLSSLLQKYGVWFDVERRVLHDNGKNIDISFDPAARYCRFGCDDDFGSVARRIYYDYCITAFLYCDDFFDYPCIHEHPEFLSDLVCALPKLKQLQNEWINKSTPYVVTFFAYVDQVQRQTFDLDNTEMFLFKIQQDLSEEQKIKKWMLFYAIEKAFENMEDLYIYIKNDVIVPPCQILTCEAIPK